ncbi:TPA: hypothetical protein ACH3X1_016170 [Trebouxia sp. C0004]
MNAEEEDAYSRMKHFCTAVRPDCDYSSWRVQTCKKKGCIEYLHQPTGLTLQSPGAAHLAVLALPTQKQPSNCTMNDSKAVSAASCSSDTEAGDLCLIITSLDKLVVQLQRHVSEMQRCHSDAAHGNAVPATTAIQPRIVQVQDVCSYIQIKADHLVMQQEDSLMKRATKLRCQLLLATCAVFAQKLLHRGSYTSGYRQHCFHTLITELLRTGPNSAALPLLVEPLLPRSWKRELDQSKLLKGDMETDLYSTAVAQVDIMQGEEEEGLAPSDGFLVADADPQLTPGKLEQVVDALDLIPLYVRQKVELKVSNALAEGLSALKSCVEQLAARFADKAAHKAWLSSLQQVVLRVEDR